MVAEMPDNLIDTVQGCAALKARMAARSLTRLYDEALKPVGLKVTQFTLLAAIKHGMPESISHLAELLAIERTTLTRNLGLLESKGLIEVGPEGYRRARSMGLTAEGEKILKRAIPLWWDVQDRVTSRLGDPDWNTAKASLTRLSAEALELKS